MTARSTMSCPKCSAIYLASEGHCPLCESHHGTGDSAIDVDRKSSTTSFYGGYFGIIPSNTSARIRLLVLAPFVFSIPLLIWSAVAISSFGPNGLLAVLGLIAGHFGPAGIVLLGSLLMGFGGMLITASVAAIIGGFNMISSALGKMPPPLHLLANRDDLESAEPLIGTEADAKSRDHHGNSALHVAAHRGNVQFMSALQKAGADVGTVNSRGETPLHMAARAGKEDAVKMLLAAGVDRDVKCNYGRTPRDVAATNNKAGVISILDDV